MLKPFTLETPFYSPEYIEFSRLVGIKNTMNGDVKKWNGFHSATPYASAYVVAKEQNLSALPTSAFSRRAFDFKRILIGEFHFVRSTKLSDDFPNAQCLKSLGISKIHLALEGYSKIESITPESAIKRRNFIEGFSYYANKNQMTLDQYIQRLKTVSKLPDGMIAKFYSGRIIDNVGMTALLEKLKILSMEGIEIKIVGLESADYTFL